MRLPSLPSRPWKIYLDACCLNRLTDDQSQSRIHQEAQAVEKVLAGVQRGIVALISSEALWEEVRRNPRMERRIEAEAILSLAASIVEIDTSIAFRARSLVALGYGPFDALHVGAAEAAGVDVMMTTDDRLIRRVGRAVGQPRIPVLNPLSWLEER